MKKRFAKCFFRLFSDTTNFHFSAALFWTKFCSYPVCAYIILICANRVTTKKRVSAPWFEFFVVFLFEQKKIFVFFVLLEFYGGAGVVKFFLTFVGIQYRFCRFRLTYFFCSSVFWWRKGCATPYGVRRHGVRYPALLRRFLLTSPRSVNRRTAPPLFQNSRFPRSGIQYRFCSFRLTYFFLFLSFLGGERGAPPLTGCATPWGAAPLAGCATPGGVRHPLRGAPPLTGCAPPFQTVTLPDDDCSGLTQAGTRGGTPYGVRHPWRGAPPLTGCATPHGVRHPSRGAPPPGR